MDSRVREEGELVQEFGLLKDAGLYVDYDGAILLQPSRIDRSKFELAERVVGRYLEQADRALERGLVKGMVENVAEAIRETSTNDPP
ncbi:MAG: hypothetical protein ACLPZM_09075 [Thermoplasmata archaeon]